METTDILDREPRWFELGVREAVYERLHHPILNRKGGLRVELSSAWDPALAEQHQSNPALSWGYINIDLVYYVVRHNTEEIWRMPYETSVLYCNNFQ